jgi:AcrR family transcriptional regulator
VGLRERNAAQTRELILDTALPLFLERGYEATTMEEIAERAQIGTSTLYRYFPSKDLLVLEPLSVRGHMAAELRTRPVEEPLDLALGHAIRALLAAPRGDTPRLRQVQAVMDDAPGLRIRLLQEFVKERTLLEQAVAERLGRPSDDVFCMVTARLAVVVLELAADLGRQDTSDDPAGQRVLDLAHGVLARLHGEPPVVPRLDESLSSS